MKRLILIFIVALALCACDLPTTTPTATGEPPIGTPVVTVEPTNTPPTVAPSVTPDPSPTATPAEPVLSPNLLDNPGFEGPYRPVIYGEVNVAHGWEPFYCDGCPAIKPDQDVMGRPEYKPIDAGSYPAQVHSGDLAQTWFCFFRSCRAGVYQTVETWPGYDYRFSVWVRSWSNFDDDPESELDTADDQAASQWTIKIDPLGGIDPDAVAMLSCHLGGIAHYDNWVEFSCDFRAESSLATIFIENTRPWGLRNQDSYVDDAFLGCWDCPDLPFSTPTPRATQGSTPLPTPDPDTLILDPSIDLTAGLFFPLVSIFKRTGHDINSAVIGGLSPGVPVPYFGRWRSPDGQTSWVCLDENAQVIPNPDFPGYAILDCNAWAAVWIGSEQYGTLE